MTRPMHPARLLFHCIDGGGNAVEAKVNAAFDGRVARWVWHASIQCDQSPTAYMLGTSPTLDDVTMDVCAQARMVILGEDLAEPIMRPGRSRVLEGPFVHANGRPGRFRAERKTDGTILTVEIVNEAGECFESLELPSLTAIDRASTEAGAMEVIYELLHRRYGATVG
ncbi:hypothetical protein KPL74_08505 [Bacillus sp. NP157]|nr:hypothetical protein KPL74_08505 [Bacillus sp. NP157]